VKSRDISLERLSTRDLRPAENGISRCSKQRATDRVTMAKIKVQVGFGLAICEICRRRAWMVLRNRIIINPRARYRLVGLFCRHKQQTMAIDLTGCLLYLKTIRETLILFH
jgi:hypothetical protein